MPVNALLLNDKTNHPKRDRTLICAPQDSLKNAVPLAFQNVSTVRQKPLVMRFVLTMSPRRQGCIHQQRSLHPAIGGSENLSHRAKRTTE
jgi:hypothetical protein